MLPNDVFDSPNEAALDFAMTYNDDSIRYGREYASSIYIIEKENSDDNYSYTVPNRGTENQNVPSRLPLIKIEDEEGHTRWGYEHDTYAAIHTHGQFDTKYVDKDTGYDGNNNFSKPDRDSIYTYGGRIYVVTPNGSLKYYEDGLGPLGTDLTDRVDGGNNIPSDVNDPTRRNNVNADDFLDNEFNQITIGEDDC